MKKNTAIMYIPVLHEGYVNFIKSLPDDTWVFVISEPVLDTLGDGFDYLRRKDILRALDSRQIVDALRSLNITVDGNIFSLHENMVRVLSTNVDNLKLICPNEDVTRAVVSKFFSKVEVEYRSMFLRWHRDNVTENKAVDVHRSIDITEFDQEMMKRAQFEASKSFDWWRQVGGVLVQDNVPILWAHNTHTLDEQLPNVFGDPRSIFKRGVRLDLTTAEHAEAVLIAEAARQGIVTEGSWLYVTTFPCPTCAMLIARAGIKRCYFAGGYSVLKGEETLTKNGVELVLVQN